MVWFFWGITLRLIPKKSILKAFKDTKIMEAARNLISLFFIFKNNNNYQVSISDKADFSTHTHQQDFHVAPDPKKIIQLGISGKRGRYVRVQLLDKNYLSLKIPK
jgi:hypothetical protein